MINKQDERDWALLRSTLNSIELTDEEWWDGVDASNPNQCCRADPDPSDEYEESTDLSELDLNNL
jgi:hypothetical protein